MFKTRMSRRKSFPFFFNLERGKKTWSSIVESKHVFDDVTRHSKVELNFIGAAKTKLDLIRFERELVD
jgi:hypothetical protein